MNFLNRIFSQISKMFKWRITFEFVPLVAHSAIIFTVAVSMLCVKYEVLEYGDIMIVLLVVIIFKDARK